MQKPSIVDYNNRLFTRTALAYDRGRLHVKQKNFQNLLQMFFCPCTKSNDLRHALEIAAVITIIIIVCNLLYMRPCSKHLQKCAKMLLNIFRKIAQVCKIACKIEHLLAQMS